MRPTIEEKYRAALAACPPRGQRHPALAGVCALGIMAGASDSEIVNDVMAAWGYSTGERAEIEDTIKRQRRRFVPKAELTGRPAERRPTRTEPPRQAGGFSAEQSLQFVRRMLEAGQGVNSFADLRRLSPTPIPPDGLGQTLAYLRTLYKPSDFIFLGNRNEARLSTRVRTVEGWADALTRPRIGGVLVPPSQLVGVNPLLGTAHVSPDGAECYRCDEAVAAGRYCRIEYDGMPVPQQLQFWGGVITTRTLPLRALTFSGGKSVHAVLEIGATTREAWDGAVLKLSSLLCCADLPDTLRADPSFVSPSHMSRTPGAMRREIGIEQTLLWLSGAALRPTPATEPPRPPPPTQDAPTLSTPFMAQKEQPPTAERKKTALPTIPANGDVYSGLVNYSPHRWRHHEHSNKDADAILNACADLSPAN